MLVDNICRTNASRKFGEKLLAAPAIGCDINNVYLVTLIKIVRSPSFAVVRRVQPLCAGVDTRRDEDHGVRLVGLVGRRQLLDIELIAPHLLAWDARINIATTDVEEISLVRSFLAATSWANAIDTTAVACRWIRV